MFVSGWISYLTSPPPGYPRQIERGRDPKKTSRAEEGSDAVGEVVGGLFVRIAIMQVAIIVGGMLAKAYGSMAPLLIVIGCKTLIDMGAHASAGSQPFPGMDDPVTPTYNAADVGVTSAARDLSCDSAAIRAAAAAAPADWSGRCGSGGRP